MKKSIVFLTSTRADFGKLKTLITCCKNHPRFNTHVFVTGMHMLPKYGSTWNEVRKLGIKNMYTYINHVGQESMETILTNTISGLSNYLKINNPDLLVVHGDRGEALAGAIVGSFGNTRVGHIEGGEVSGTIDESIRHAVSKLVHLHFVSNKKAKKRLIQMGENEHSIHVIGSPDLDLMKSELPKIEEVKWYYDIPFDKYSILIYHPVTTIKPSFLLKGITNLIQALLESGQKYVIIEPNNDPGSDIIRESYERLKKNDNFRIFPSIQFEKFLSLLKNCKFMIGNSSAGIREAPFYGIPTINLGSRQQGRHQCPSVINTEENKDKILKTMLVAEKMKRRYYKDFGDGKSTEKFLNVLLKDNTWNFEIQKKFLDIDFRSSMGV